MSDGQMFENSRVLRDMLEALRASQERTANWWDETPSEEPLTFRYVPHAGARRRTEDEYTFRHKYAGEPSQARGMVIPGEVLAIRDEEIP